MKTDEIREKYLDFFKSKGHTVCPSDVLVPKWDHTVLFTPAGMNPFKDHFLGNVELEFYPLDFCDSIRRVWIPVARCHPLADKVTSNQTAE